MRSQTCKAGLFIAPRLLLDVRLFPPSDTEAKHSANDPENTYDYEADPEEHDYRGYIP